jgi:hypothetical protein
MAKCDLEVVSFDPGLVEEECHVRRIAISIVRGTHPVLCFFWDDRTSSFHVPFRKTSSILDQLSDSCLFRTADLTVTIVTCSTAAFSDSSAAGH